MQTLQGPVYEIHQESDYYKVVKERKDSNVRVNEILGGIAKEFGFDSAEFFYYGSGGFGFERYSKGYEKFEVHLTKNADRNGIHTFKRNSIPYKKISKLLKEVYEIEEKVDPFALRDIFGFNNLSASQWVGDRYFVGAKSEELVLERIEARKSKVATKDGDDFIEPIAQISYRDYLLLVAEALAKEAVHKK